MLDEDYKSLSRHSEGVQSTAEASQIVREIILPEIKKEVNTGKNFAPLRQIYHALILAKWYKETIQNGLLDTIYTNKNKVAGVNLNDPAIKEKIYQRYLKAYEKGAFNYIKEDSFPPRKYFSGGITEIEPRYIDRSGRRSDVQGNSAMMVLEVKLIKDAAMLGIHAFSDSSGSFQGLLTALIILVLKLHTVKLKILASKASIFIKNKAPLAQTIINDLQYRDKIPGGVKINDIVILGNDELNVFRHALGLWRQHPDSRIVILGGKGRLTQPLIEKAAQAGFKIEDASSEAVIIKQIMKDMIAEESQFADLKAGSTQPVFELEVDSTTTPENIKNYKGKIEDKLKQYNKGNPYHIIYLQTSHQQLRAKATVEKYLKSDIDDGRIIAFSDTARYDRPLENQALDALGEAVRMIIYSDRGNGTIANENDDLPDAFWQHVIDFYNTFSGPQRIQNASFLMGLIKGTKRNGQELNIDGLIQGFPENNKQRIFLELIKADSAMSDQAVVVPAVESFNPFSVARDILENLPNAGLAIDPKRIRLLGNALQLARLLMDMQKDVPLDEINDQARKDNVSRPLLIQALNYFLSSSNERDQVRAASLIYNLYLDTKTESRTEDLKVAYKRANRKIDILNGEPVENMDQAQSSLLKSRDQLGGIDLDSIKVNRAGNVIKVLFDQAQLNELMQGGFEGFTPVITKMMRISSPFQFFNDKGFISI